MSTISMNLDKFIQSVEPGIVSLVVQAFKDKLEEKLQGVIDEVYDECVAKLPDEIRTKVKTVLVPDPGIYGDRLDINVIIEERPEGEG